MSFYLLNLMSYQLRYRLFTIWILASCLFLVAFHISQSGTVAGLLAWNDIGAVDVEPKPNAAIVMLVAPSRITRAFICSLSQIRMHLSHMQGQSPWWLFGISRTGSIVVSSILTLF